MDEINLSARDRARIDLLVDQLERWNGLNEGEVLVSCTEAARLLGRTSQTISQMLKDGRLRKATIGRSTGIRLSDVRDIMRR